MEGKILELLSNLCILSLFAGKIFKNESLDGLEPSTFRLTAERANQLRHGSHEEIHAEYYY